MSELPEPNPVLSEIERELERAARALDAAAGDLRDSATALLAQLDALRAAPESPPSRPAQPGLGRRSGYDRRSGEDRRRGRPEGLAARIISSTERRTMGERRSGVERRRAEAPAWAG